MMICVSTGNWIVFISEPRTHTKDFHCILFSEVSDNSNAVVCLETAKIFLKSMQSK